MCGLGWAAVSRWGLRTSTAVRPRGNGERVSALYYWRFLSLIAAPPRLHGLGSAASFCAPGWGRVSTWPGPVDDPIGEEKVVGESPTTMPCLARQTRRPSGLSLSLQACGAPHPLRWPPKTRSPRRLRLRLLGRAQWSSSAVPLRRHQVLFQSLGPVALTATSL